MGHYLSEMEYSEPVYIPKKKDKPYSESILRTLIIETPLETRLYAINDMLILDYLVEIGVIPDGYWSDKKEKKYGRQLHKFAKKLTKVQIKEIKKWEKDGRPK